MKNYFLCSMVLTEILTGTSIVYATNSSLMEIFGDEKAPVPQVAPLETGRLDAAQRIFDLSVIGKCQTNNDPNNELKLDIQGRDMPELFAVNDEGKLVYAQPQPMSVITMPRGHCARVIVELEKIKNNYTDTENVPENIKRSEDYLCLGIRKNSKIINALYIVENHRERAFAQINMDSEEAIELVPLVNNKKLSDGYEIAAPNTVVLEDFIAVGETLDFSSVYRININAVTIRIDGEEVHVNAECPFMVNLIPNITGITGIVEFFDDNKIEDNVGVHIISEPTTFNFSGGEPPSGTHYEVSSTRGKNFAHNLSKYKIRYSLEKSVKITEIILKDQWIRDYVGQYDRNRRGYKQLILNDGQLAERTSSVSGSAYSVYFILKQQLENNLSEIYGIHEALNLFRDSCMELGEENWNISVYDWGSEYHYTRPRMEQNNANLYWNISGVKNNVEVYSLGGESNYRWHGNDKKNVQQIPASGTKWLSSPVEIISDPQIIAAAADNYILQVYVLNETNEKHLITTNNVDEAMRKNQGVVLCNLDHDLSTQIVAGDYICFQGDGELSVTVSPAGTISHTTPTDQTITTTLTEPQTITIDPVNYKYEPCDTGGYVIRFATEGVTLSLE